MECPCRGRVFHSHRRSRDTNKKRKPLMQELPLRLSKKSRGRCRRDRSPADCNRIAWLCRAGGEVSAAAETIPYIFHGRQPWLTVKNAKAFLEKVTAVTFSTRKEEASYAEASSFIIFLATIPFTPLRARPWLPAWRLPNRLRPPPYKTPALQIPTASWSRRTAGSPWWPADSG